MAAMDDTADERRAERAARAESHGEARRRVTDQDTTKAQALLDDFLSEAARVGLPAERLTARPWSGGGRYRTQVTGWYLRKDRSIGLGTDGAYYVLVVAPVRLGRWRTVEVHPTPPRLQVAEGGRDGDAVALDHLLELRFTWDDATS